jgi:uncharacterized protein YqeY
MAEQRIKDRITEAMKDCMRAKEKEKLGCIRLILADFKRIEVDERIEIDDARALVIMDKMLKQRRDSIQQFEAAGRQDLAEKEAFELTVINEFLPAALTDEEIAGFIKSAIEQTSASSMQDMGKVMAIIKPLIQGRADAGVVSQRVKQALV